MGWFSLFFVLSGFCGLVYQVVWLRIAMASFGVTTPLVSIVLSVFMAGLAAGSWLGGKLAARLEGRGPGAFLRLYAVAELLIGASGVAVAPLLGLGRAALTSSGGDTSWGSGGYYLASAGWVAGALLPFCIAMGATFPLAMGGIRAAFRDASPRSFSLLYVANVLGAMAGALGSAFVMIELLGFRKTLLVATAVNATVSALALLASLRLGAVPPTERAPEKPERDVPVFRLGLAYLFTTGLVSLALEVVWTRQFVPFQGPVVYAFATILGVYLAATLLGSRLYRARAEKVPVEDAGFPWLDAGLLTGASGLLALLAADPRLPLPRGFSSGGLRVLLGIGPFCAVLGYFTPMLVDRVSRGHPGRAGTAYAVNTVGCIFGPLLAGFVLLPYLGERFTTLVLVLPLFVFAAAGPRAGWQASRPRVSWRLAGLAAASVALVALTRDIETEFPDAIVRRDHTATVIATGNGMGKRLLVNGVGITYLTPITKMMAHLPLAWLGRPPRNGLVLCLGMGTSYRSMLSWGIPSTAVELVPSIPPLLGFYHQDGEALRRHPLGRIVVDDARRFLERSAETFDVIVVDPPPPVRAATSSLLYSSEFYEVAKRRLAPDGILQQWLPLGEKVVISSVSKALTERFAHVRVFRSLQGWGFHFLASDRPIASRSASELAARLPGDATRDLLEWGPARFADDQFQGVLAEEVRLRAVTDADPAATALTDDRPVNEYYFLRGLLGPAEATRRYH